MFRDKKFRDKNFRAQTFEEIISSGIKKSLGIRILGIKFKEHQLLCSQFNFLNFNLHNLAAATCIFTVLQLAWLPLRNVNGEWFKKCSTENTRIQTQSMTPCYFVTGF
jgi:hypothetical protein